MDPVTMTAVLTAVAAGGGEALAGRAWEGLGVLVRRPFRREGASPAGPPMVSTGEAELAALAQSPADESGAAALAEVLDARAAVDSEFAAALASWWELAREVKVSGNVTNTISGGTQHGPVLQGRDFTGLTFGSPPVPPPAQDPGA
jgi:hypothetical protein